MARKRSSPWAEFSEQRRASARKYNDLCNELGMAFKEAQQDAYEQWLILDEPIPEVFDDVERVRPHGEGLVEHLVKWITSAWQPQWVTAASGQEQEHVFQTEYGEIELVCSWSSQHHETPAYISVYWRANISTFSELWVRFTRPDTETLISEFRLGSEMDGNIVFISNDLGFDPSIERWAISIVLKDIDT
jgi:hypothetical protein